METRSNFTPLPWQVPAWNDLSLTLLLTGSAGGGKSRLAAEKVHAACLEYPGTTWLLMRKAREWNKTSIIPFMHETILHGTGKVRLVDSTFKYPNGSCVYTGGMNDEEQREAVRSIGGAGGLDGAWLEEGTAFTRADFNEVLGRMRHNAMGWRQIIISTNPGAPMHWINTDLIKGKQAAIYYSGAKDNPHNSPDYLGILEKMTGLQYKRMVLGHWVQAEGAIYDSFDYSVHVRDRDQGEMQYWIIGIDPGFTNPTAMGLIGIDDDGRLHLFEEVYRRGMLHEAIVAKAYEWAKERHRGSVAVVCDESAAELIAELNNAGLRAEGTKGRVLDGISLVQEMLVVQGDEKPRLTFSPSCVNAIQEFESYAWRLGKEEPVKENDHICDLIRYSVFWCYGETVVKRQYIYAPERIG